MPTSLEDARKRIAAKMSQRKGTHGESVARLALERFGIKQVVRIETGWRIKRIGGRVVGATPMAKVTADWRGLYDGGRSVLAEAKERTDRIVWSDLEPHQHAALREHELCGGASFLVAIFSGVRRAYIIPYMLCGLERGGPAITPATAPDLDVFWMAY